MQFINGANKFIKSHNEARTLLHPARRSSPTTPLDPPQNGCQNEKSTFFWRIKYQT